MRSECSWRDASRLLSKTVFAVAAVSLAVACRSKGSGEPNNTPRPQVPPGPYIPGQSYFGRNQYIEYIAGNAPVIFTASHGGALVPAEIPIRACGTNVTDSNTEALARTVRTTFFTRTGKYPHIIINRLERNRLDANRDSSEAACGNAAALVAWQEWHALIDIAKAAAVAGAGRAWYTDLHGHGHAIPRLELGYLISSAQLDLTDAQIDLRPDLETSSGVRTLSRDDTTTTFAQLLRGPQSLGALFAAEGFRSVPSLTDPSPLGAEYFNGGYNTERHGCQAGGVVCGVQIEANLAGVRDTEANRARFAEAIVKVTVAYLRTRWGLSI
ncbi:MAG: hypothetical protein ACT4P7_05695 [Gemmatimonadaceae bacterium]